MFLLRLNFFGSKERKSFMQTNPPQRCYVHSKRMSFVTEDVRRRVIAEAKAAGKKPKGLGTDSIEYAHMVWQKGLKNRVTVLRVI